MSNEIHIHDESCGHTKNVVSAPPSLKSRLSFEEIYMRFAFELSKRSTCLRLSVGCVITSVDYSRVYGIGYNGNARGLPNSCESQEPGNCGCLHAEDNALLKTSEGAEVAKIVFVTHQPCAYCAKRMVNKGGIRKVYFSEPYRLRRGLEILEQAGISVEQLNLAAQRGFSD